MYHAFRSIIVIRPSEVFSSLMRRSTSAWGSGVTGTGDHDHPGRLDNERAIRCSIGGGQARRRGRRRPDGASSAERLGRRDFGEMSAAESEEVRRLIAKMVWRPADARSVGTPLPGAGPNRTSAGPCAVPSN